MQKDPALLWYFNDWMGGTATLSRHLKGCYIDLLCVQFNSGPLSLEEIKTVLGSDFGQSWPVLQKKFKFENGRYFNERMEHERLKRSSFVESRRKNGEKHKVKLVEDRDINENKLPNWLNLKAWEAWLRYRKEINKTLKPSTVKFQLKFLEKHKQDHIEIIRNSITNGWTGLFALKTGGQRQPNTYQAYDTSKEDNERSRFLMDQAFNLAEKMKIV